MNKYLLVVISTGLLITSCLWVTSFETAQTAPPGQLQFGGSLSPLTISRENGESNSMILPFPMTSLKLGVADQFDIGAKWGLGPGFGLNTKYQFLRNSIDGAIFFEFLYYGLGTFGGDDPFSIYNLRPSVIISNEAPGTFPFSTALGLHYWNTGVLGNRIGITSLVANLGIPFRVGVKRGVRIMPEIGILMPFSGSADGDTNDNFTFTGQTIMQFGFSIGGANPTE